MQHRSKWVIIICAIAFFITACNKREDIPGFNGPYFGQERPGDEPQLFMPGLVSTNYLDRCVGFFNDGRVCIYQSYTEGKTRTFYTYINKDRWTESQRIPFENARGGTDFTTTPDNRTLVFQSSRLTSASDSRRETNTWAVEWTGSGWTEPRPLPSPANTDQYNESYPSLTSDGSLYFFTGSQPDSQLGDVYWSKMEDGEYQEHERFAYPINTEYHEIDPCVAPDGSYLLIESGRPGGFTFFDTYISFRRSDGTWSSAHNLGQAINSYCPGLIRVTLEGKYMFFTSSRRTDIPKGEPVSSKEVEQWGDYDVYWVDTRVFDSLKEKVFHEASAGEAIAGEYKTNGLQAALVKLGELYDNKKEPCYFELSELMILCGQMIQAGNSGDAEEFYRALLNTLPDGFRIRLGYAQTLLLNGHTRKGLDLLKILKNDIPTELLKSTFSHYAWELRQRSFPEGALEVLLYTIQEFPDAYYFYFNVSQIYEELDKLDEAVQYCRKALEIYPDFNEAAEMLKRLEEK